MNTEIWNLDGFNQKRTPTEIGTLRFPERFSGRGEAPIRVLDLPIRMPGQGLRLPSGLAQFGEAIDLARWAEERQVHRDRWDQTYCYITVDQKPVAPGVSQRRAGAHSDAYVVDAGGHQLDVTVENASRFPVGTPIERTYLAYDCLPTVCWEGPFQIKCDPADCDSVQAGFDQQKEGMGSIQFPPFTVVMLTPYDVHEAAPNLTDSPIERTFVKIAFSTHRYNREGNTHNPLFDYDWEMVPRKTGVREHRFSLTT